MPPTTLVSVSERSEVWEVRLVVSVSSERRRRIVTCQSALASLFTGGLSVNYGRLVTSGKLLCNTGATGPGGGFNILGEIPAAGKGQLVTMRRSREHLTLVCFIC